MCIYTYVHVCACVYINKCGKLKYNNYVIKQIYIYVHR